jgi:hypothetical protein
LLNQYDHPSHKTKKIVEELCMVRNADVSKVSNKKEARTSSKKPLGRGNRQGPDQKKMHSLYGTLTNPPAFSRAVMKLTT